ncbi:MAG TPA: ribosomal protein S18-alanine N-acetyltransferase [Candidatus Limnocylindria bacterium]|jgi:ribosomal-protein-alanine N-acetyltransferase
MAIGTPLTVDAMRTADIEAVHEIERLSFSSPWPTYAFEQELRGNRLARYVVARAGTIDGDRVVGFAGLWLMVDEGHITTFGVHPDWRRQGVGARLMLRLVDIALELGAARMTLEVRVRNQAAQELYRRFGFAIAGTRVRYYTDNGEDAFVMTTPALSDAAMRDIIAVEREQLEGRTG